ncbi:hypothetical protein [uncultured Kordia sp.]|uniref:hypothetical protein n=1 Tax=uncultured Kordia sp. TaxID=507699 RepID=UPI0026395F30|nr:hypothetical protein [uncultured Kordia sp.]
MKDTIIFFLCLIFAFANVQAQEFPKPETASPEATFYTYLDNENISDPTKFNGNVKKVIRTFKEYEQGGVDAISLEKTSLYVNKNGVLEKTVRRTYSYGIEDSKEITYHLEEPKADIKKDGNRIEKIINRTQAQDDEHLYDVDLQGDDHYVYENDRLIAFYNNNDSISYVYDAKNRLTSVRISESLIAEEYNEEEDVVSYMRSTFEDKGLEQVYYINDLPARKIVYDKFGEVIDVYKKTYTYTSNKLLEKFQTEYKRYLFDYYEAEVPIEKQKYAEFPRVETNDSIQTGTFQYSKTNKITSYQRTKGAEEETYTVIYDDNDQMHLVEGTLTFYQKGRLVSLEVEYEYLYDKKGNPSSIRSFYYLGGEKILHRETTFEIAYY